MKNSLISRSKTLPENEPKIDDIQELVLADRTKMEMNINYIGIIFI